MIVHPLFPQVPLGYVHAVFCIVRLINTHRQGSYVLIFSICCSYPLFCQTDRTKSEALQDCTECTVMKENSITPEAN
jgi:hypothetical protein